MTTSTAATESHGTSRNDQHSVRTGEVAGIVIGGCAVLALLAAIIYFAVKLRRRRNHGVGQDDTPVDRAASQIEQVHTNTQTVHSGRLSEAISGDHKILPDYMRLSASPTPITPLMTGQTTQCSPPDAHHGLTALMEASEHNRQDTPSMGDQLAELPAHDHSAVRAYTPPPRQLSWSPGSEMSYRP